MFININTTFIWICTPNPCLRRFRLAAGVFVFWIHFCTKFPFDSFVNICQYFRLPFAYCLKAEPHSYEGTWKPRASRCPTQCRTNLVRSTVCMHHEAIRTCANMCIYIFIRAPQINIFTIYIYIYIYEYIYIYIYLADMYLANKYMHIYI